MQASTAQTSIARPWREVCDFLARPANFAAWASWLGPSLRQERGDWTVHRAGGLRAKVRFSERNAFGVADHWLLEDEDRVAFVALRAVPNGEASEVLLTCFREPGCGEAEWAALQQAMQRDLGRLQQALQPVRPQGTGRGRYDADGEGCALPASWTTA
jgi:hypothetical protein